MTRIIRTIRFRTTHVLHKNPYWFPKCWLSPGTHFLVVPLLISKKVVSCEKWTSIFIVTLQNVVRNEKTKKSNLMLFVHIWYRLPKTIKRKFENGHTDHLGRGKAYNSRKKILDELIYCSPPGVRYGTIPHF